jgi:hypothetical protein
MENIIFEDYFKKSKGEPFMYNFKEIKLSDKVLLTKSKVKIRITFISTDSPWKQGIGLKTAGNFEVNNKSIFNNIVLWEDTAPKELEIIVKSKNGMLFIYNVWDTGDGTMHYGHNGGAMYVENALGVKVYNCNDGYPDDDLNDLIFTVQCF